MADADAAPGRLTAAGGRAFVLALPLPTSLPIPLAVTAPAGVALATWAFAGLGTGRPSRPDPHPGVATRSGAASQDEGGDGSRGDRQGPRVLLLLAARDAAAEAFLRAGRGALTLATHYRDVRVTLAACDPFEALPRDDRRCLARAVLADAGAVLADLDDLPELDPAVEAQPPAADAPAITFPKAGEAVLAGSLVPDRLLLRAGAERWLARVAAARLRFAPEPSVALTLDRAGPVPDLRPETVLALSGDGARPLRVETA